MLPTVNHALMPAPASGAAQPIPVDGRERRRLALTSRECPPGLGPWVQRRCLRDPSLLPRRHQADRHRRRRGGDPIGIHYATPVEAYAGIAAWVSREHFLDVVVDEALAADPDVRQRRRPGEPKVLVSEDLLRRYLRVRTGYAHARTGRGAIVRPDTLASVLGVTPRAVKYAQLVARRLGVEVVVQTGRMLSWAERMAARRSGSHQRGLATEVAFTIPETVHRRLARRHLLPADASRRGGRFHPSKRSKTSPQTDLFLHSPDAARGEKKEAASPPPRRRGPSRRMIAGRRLAGDLLRVLPWLAGESPGRLAPALCRFAAADVPWSAADIALALLDLARRRGITAPLTADRIRTRPAVVLARLLERLDAEADHPSARAFPTDAEVAALKPCRRMDCDGHGWLSITDGRGREVAARCPDCPPALRAIASWARHDLPDVDGAAGGPLRGPLSEGAVTGARHDEGQEGTS